MTVKLTEGQIAALKTVADGTTSGTFVHSTPKSMKFYLDNGLVEANPTVKNDKGENPFRITEAGTAALANVGGTPAEGQNGGAEGQTGTPAPVAEAPKNLFVMQMLAPLPVARTAPKNTTPREPKYPLADLVEGQALFIPSPADANAKSKSKGFGSMVSTFNDKNADKYLTSRYIADGKVAGFVGVHGADAKDEAGNSIAGQPNPEAFAGVAGTGIYRMPLDQKPARKTKKAKAEQAAAAEAEAAAAAAAANGAAAGQPAA